MGILCWINRVLAKSLDCGYHVAALGIRYWMFTVFYHAASIKFASWSSTLMLFQYEYKSSWLPLPPPLVEKYNLTIPQIPYELAAYLGSGMEMALAWLVLLGIGSRISILLLFIFNYIALVSYPLLWTPDYLAAFKEHIIWGLAISVLLFKDYGWFSIDKFIRSKWCDGKKTY